LFVGISDSTLEINIFTDKETRTLTIVDNGIGMAKEELISNLGDKCLFYD
jgi:molecular chaperone HtpG